MRLRARSAPLLVFAASIFVSACSDDEKAAKDNPDAASSDAGDSDGGICPTSGVSKRPWVLHVDSGSALVRWEACNKESSPDLSFSLESGGSERQVTATVSEVVIPNTYLAPLGFQIPPDAAGTYYMREAALTGLEPGRCYAYVLAADSEHKGRFCTARPPGQPFKIMAVGDTNPGLGTTPKLLQNVANEGYEIVLHEGDIQYYASGLETWQSWFALMSPMFAQGAFLPAIGNHESEKSDELELYTLRFFDKAGFDGKDGYFRAESGGVWFFSLNTELSLDAGSEQALWFEAKLKDAAAKPGYRFSIVFFHRPFLTCGDTSQKDGERQLLEPLFQQYGVPLVLQGHMHGYERFEVASGGDGGQQAITYLTLGGGGGALGEIDENKSRPTCSMRVASGAFYHVAILEIGATALSVRVIDATGTVRDTFTKTVP